MSVAAPTQSLTETPIPALDEAWIQGLRSAPESLQDSILEEADRLRSSDDDDQWRALAVYRALVDRLEPWSVVNLARLAWVSREDPVHDDVTRRIGALTLGHPDPVVRRQGALLLAGCDLMEDRLAEAETALRALLREVRGSFDRTGLEMEMNAWHHLSRAFEHGRREVESLVAARQAHAIGSRIRDLHPVYRAQVTIALAGTYAMLEDWGRMEDMLERAGTIVPLLYAPDARVLEFEVSRLQFDAALGCRDWGLAARRLEEHRRAAQARGTGPAFSRTLAYLEARLALCRGRPFEARAALESATGPGPSAPRHRIAAEVVEIETLARTEGRAAVRDRALDIVTRLEDEEGTGLPHGTRLREGDRLGTLLAGPCEAPDLAVRAYRVAADAALRRMSQLERTLREMPELVAQDPDDVSALASYRIGFARRHGQVLSALGDLLAAAARRGERPPWADLTTDGLVAVCAWCHSLRAPDGTWLPLGHLVLPTDPVAVTHGMCDPCLDRVMHDVGTL